MALAEFLAIFAELFTSTFHLLGKTISCFASFIPSLLHLVNVVLIFLLGCVEYFWACIVILGMILAEIFIFGIPHLWEAVWNCGCLVQDLLIYCANSALNFVISLWSSPMFYDVRELAVDYVQLGIKKVLNAVYTNPLLVAQIFLGSTWILLVLNFRKDIWKFKNRMVTAVKHKLDSSKAKLRLFNEQLKLWILLPYHFILRIPCRIAGIFVKPILYVKRIPSAGTAYVQEKLKNTTMAIWRNPVFRTKKPDPELETMEKLKSENYKLRLRLEEERGSKLCVICESNFREIVHMPCRHFAICGECDALLLPNLLYRKTCPVCRTQIASTVKVYL